MEELAKRLTEVAVDDDDIALYWRVEVSAVNIVVAAATRDLYPDQEAAWRGAGELWRAILDLGYELTDEGESEIGVLRRPDLDKPPLGWRGKVRMVPHHRV